jgi:hypothetical protein
MNAANVEAVRQAAKQFPAVSEVVAVLAKISGEGIRALSAEHTAILKDAEVAAGLIAFDQQKDD